MLACGLIGAVATFSTSWLIALSPSKRMFDWRDGLRLARNGQVVMFQHGVRTGEHRFIIVGPYRTKSRSTDDREATIPIEAVRPHWLNGTDWVFSGPFDPRCSRDLHGFGWPFIALAWGGEIDQSAYRTPGYKPRYWTGLPTRANWFDGGDAHVLPTQICWLGFASNTAIFATGAFALLHVLRLGLKLRRRPSSTVCEQCGYDLRGSTVAICSECGATKVNMA